MNKTDWLAFNVREIDLPSGMKVTIRKPSQLQVIEAGYIPSQLTKAAIEVFEQGAEAVKELDELEQRDLVVEAKRLLTCLIAAALIEPKLTVEDVELIPPDDFDTLAGEIMRVREVAQLEPFREVIEGADVGEHSEDVQRAPVHANGS